MREWYCKRCHRVWMGPRECCGDVVTFSPFLHGKYVVALSNAWIEVWDKWRDHPVVREVTKEWAEQGNCGAAGILNEAFGRISRAGDDESRVADRNMTEDQHILIETLKAMQESIDALGVRATKLEEGPCEETTREQTAILVLDEQIKIILDRIAEINARLIAVEAKLN
jgi:hypothetical protein